MSLKSRLSGDEFGTLEESLQGFYKESSDGYVLDAEGIEDVGGLKSALDKERKARSQYERDLKSFRDKYQDLDPEEAREAIKKSRELEENSLKDKGQFEEALAKRAERMKAEHEVQIKGYDEKYKTVSGELDSLKKELTSLKIDGAISEAASKAGVKPAALADVLYRGRDVFRLEEGQPTPYKNDQIWYGKNPSEPMTIDEWVGVLKADAGHLFDEATGGGSRASHGVSGGSIKITVAQASDRQTYVKMKEKADKAGVKLEITE